MLYGYVRCSTDRQVVLSQVDALRAAGCERIFRDKAIRATDKNRPGLRAVRKKLVRGDVFAITSLCRAFRSAREALEFLDDIQAHGIGVRILVQNVDTRTPEGRHWYTVTAADAELESAKIARRTRDYMAAAKRRGKKFGRPRKLTKAKIAKAHEAVRSREGRTMDQIARSLRISRRSLFRALRQTSS